MGVPGYNSTYTKQRPQGLCFSKERANMNLWTPWDKESTFLPACSVHQDIALSYPRSLCTDPV